jgi:hypothetical protein
MLDRLKKLLATDGGSALVAELERESYEKEKVVRRRHELGEQIDAATARRAKEFPPLEAVRVQAVEAFDEARRNVSRCQQEAEDAASNVFDVNWVTDNVVRAAKAELRATAERWLKDAIEYANDRRCEFHNTECKKLHSWYDEKVSVDPDPSDPDYKEMRRAGAKYRMRRVCTNTPALDELREGMRHACDRLERMTEDVVPPTKAEVDAILVIFKDHTWREYASRFTWREPTPPRFDENGSWIGTNLPEVRS